MDCDPGVAVYALVDERERQLKWVALVGLGHDSGGFREHGRQRFGQRTGQFGCGTIWRGGEYEVEGAVACSAQMGERVAAVDGSVAAHRVQVAPDRLDRTRVAVHEHGRV